MRMVTPDFLKAGDKIGIVSPAKKVSLLDIEPSLKVFERWGLDVILSPNLFSSDHSYLAGKDEQRLQDFQSMIGDPQISAIICARGGYGTTRILDNLDLQPLLRNPKWVVGFSDITALHLKLFRLGVESLHATMPIFFSKTDSVTSIESLRRSLFGLSEPLKAKPNAYNRYGVVRGQVVGGNLSLIVESMGTPSEPDLTGKILVIEEIEEYLYKVDRMLTQLKRAGKLAALRGLVVGHMTDMMDTSPAFRETIEEIVLDKVHIHDYPVVFDFPIGHENPNFAWAHGSTMSLSVDDQGGLLTPASANVS